MPMIFYVTHVEGAIEPIRDIETVNLELALADLQTAEKRLERFSRVAKSGDKDAAFHRDVAAKMVSVLGEGRAIRSADWSAGEWESVRDAHLLTAKPELYVCNVDEDGLTGNPRVEAVRSFAQAEGSGIVVICAQVEQDIAELEPSDQAEFLADLGLEEPGLAVLARETYRLLGLITFFTVGPVAIRAWTVRAGTKAAAAAGVIHTDFERGFIRAEVYRIPDLLRHGSEVALRAAGLIRVEGRDYVVHDGDVIFFRFNV